MLGHTILATIVFFINFGSEVDACTGRNHKNENDYIALHPNHFI